MPEKTNEPMLPAKQPAAATEPQYEILSGGVTLALGVAAYTGAIVTGAQIGSTARVASLLEKGRIREARPDATD